jgi:CTP-dependent riboflavin kinase
LEHRDDLRNYFYRGICAFGFSAKAFGEDELFTSIQKYRDQFAEASGMNITFKQ